MRTITLYNPTTGEFGPIITGMDEELAAYEDTTFKEGAWQTTTHSVNILNGEIVERPPPAPTYNEQRQKRNELLDDYRWTIMPDSPLSVANQAEWLAYLQHLHTLFIDYTPGDVITFPQQPGFIYAETTNNG